MAKISVTRVSFEDDFGSCFVGTYANCFADEFRSGTARRTDALRIRPNTRCGHSSIAQASLRHRSSVPQAALRASVENPVARSNQLSRFRRNGPCTFPLLGPIDHLPQFTTALRNGGFDASFQRQIVDEGLDVDAIGNM